MAAAPKGGKMVPCHFDIVRGIDEIVIDREHHPMA
jgi:hypothetical protein